MLSVAKKIVPVQIKSFVKQNYTRFQISGNQKIFGIGNNKTGTTSLRAAMTELGFVVGDQRKAENLMHDWAKRDFKSIVEYCKYAEFFQDAPFSKPFTYVVLDHEFPGSKFILTIRDSPEQWYNSLVKYHSKKWGKNGRLPTKEDLQQATYIYKGRPWVTNRLNGITSEDDLYNKELLIEHYKEYNDAVIDYFQHRPGDLLILNVAEKGAYRELCDFLEIKANKEEFPWKNKTEVQN